MTSNLLKSLGAAAILAAGFTAPQANAASVTIFTDSGKELVTRQGVGEDTGIDGAGLVGMLVTAAFRDGTTAAMTWGTLTKTGWGGVSVSGFSLAMGVSGGFQLSTTKVLRSLTLNAGSASAIFDILTKAEGDTPTTKRGYPFELVDGSALTGDIGVTYSDIVALGNAPAVGDIFATMTADFSALDGGGLEGDVEFKTDLDVLAVAGDLAPVPLPAGMPLLIAGIAALGLQRRRRR